ncbi:MAG: hypothetical protein ACHQFW_08805 [Chitinophagales bacterium]
MKQPMLEFVSGIKYQVSGQRWLAICETNETYEVFFLPTWLKWKNEKEMFHIQRMKKDKLTPSPERRGYGVRKEAEGKYLVS